MPVMTCQLCRKANKYCEPRVCSRCRGQYYRCYDCNDADCPCGPGGRWLLLSEARDRGITPRAPQVLDVPKRGASREPSSSSSATQKPKREPRDELKLKRTHSHAELKSNSAKRIADDGEKDRDEDRDEGGGDDDEQGGDAIIIDAPLTTQASSTQGALVISPHGVSAQTVIGATGKMPLSQFLALVKALNAGIAQICPEGGMTCNDWEQRYQQLEAQRRRLLELLGGPSCISGVVEHGGIAGLIEKIDPYLLHAADVLRTLRAELDRIQQDQLLQLGPAKPTRECRVRARAGEQMIRCWKILQSYSAIWMGGKWKTAGLQDEVGEGNPVKLLSQRNIDRLMAELRRERNSRLDLDRLFRRKLRAEGRYVLLGDEIEELHERLDELNNDPQEEPDPDCVEEIESEIAELLLERERADVTASLLEQRLARLGSGMGLEADEHELFIELLKLPYKLKHATNAWYCIANDGRLDSYTEIKRKHPDWQSEFSTGGNIQALGNGGFVFFRLDVGCNAIDTRYGETLVVYDMDLLVQHGWVSMYDQLKPLASDTMKRTYDGSRQLIRTAEVCGVSETKIKYRYGCTPRQSVPVNSSKPNARERFRTVEAKEFDDEWFEREVCFIDLVFYGPQIHLGIALSVILELRFLRQCGYRQTVLTEFLQCSAAGGTPDGSVVSKRHQYLAHLLSRLFRPEAKYPVALRLSQHEPQEVRKPEGDKRYLSDGTENAKAMQAVRLEQRRKELETQLHVTRQQRGAAAKRGKTARSNQEAAAAEGKHGAAAKFGDKAKEHEGKAKEWGAKTVKLETELAEVKRQLK